MSSRINIQPFLSQSTLRMLLEIANRCEVHLLLARRGFGFRDAALSALFLDFSGIFEFSDRPLLSSAFNLWFFDEPGHL
jgi:hypothetical protein